MLRPSKTMTLAIETISIFAYQGPNINSPEPGVLLRVRCDRDRRRRLRDALKDGAQFIGLVLAGLTLECQPSPAGLLISAYFSTAEPALGAALAAYVVEGIAAQTRDDQDWDREGPLFALQQRRRREALPISAVQRIAEARERRIPVLRRPDGLVQLGYGARGWVFDPAAKPSPTPPWNALGSIPIIAVTGATQRPALIARAVAELRSQGLQPAIGDEFSHAAIIALLADSTSQALVLGLDSAAILRHGLPFERCTRAIVGHMGDQRPPEALDDAEWARAAALPMLIADAPALFDLADLRLQAVVGYAPYGVISL